MIPRFRILEVEPTTGKTFLRNNISKDWIFSVPEYLRHPASGEHLRFEYYYPEGKSGVPQVFTNGLNTGEEPLDLNGHKFLVKGPKENCVVFFLFHRCVTTPEPPYTRFFKGYDAWVFDGEKWNPWLRPQEIEISYSELSGRGLEISLKKGKRSIAWAESLKDAHRFLETRHFFDYSVGELSLADLLTIQHEQDRMEKDVERWLHVHKAYDLAKSLKGAVRSVTAAQIVTHLEKAIFPF